MSIQYRNGFRKVNNSLDNVRVDQLLVEKGLCASRTQSQKLLEGGLVQVQVSGQWIRVLKSSQKFSVDSEFRVELGEEQRFVSRAGLKLQAALDRLEIDLADTIALDIGQSTGGFSDCLVQNGALKVIGVDVGHGQLAEKLRRNPQVIGFEGVNARALDAAFFSSRGLPSQFELIVMDVSFISQTLILPQLIDLLDVGARLVSLVKPQFEVGPARLGKGGIVKDERALEELQASLTQLVSELGLQVDDYFASPITGGDGNREFLLCARKR